MSDLFLLSELQMARISSLFPLSHGVKRVDDRRDQRDHLRDPARAAVERLRQKPMAPTTPYTIALCAGAFSGCSTASSWRWPRRAVSPSGS